MARIWTPEELDYLEHFYGRRRDDRIAGDLGRTVKAVQLCARRNRIYKRDHGLTLIQIARFAGVHSSVVSKWVARGDLRPGPPRWMAGRRSVRYVSERQFLRLLKERSDLFDRDKMPDSPYRQLVEEWIETVEAKRRGGPHEETLGRWIRQGLVDGRRRGRKWLVRASDLSAIKALNDEHRSGQYRWSRRSANP